MASIPVSELIDSCRKDDRLSSLRALREKLAVSIEYADRGADVAALSLRLTDVLKQIEALAESSQEAPPDVVNEVLERAKKRKAG